MSTSTADSSGMFSASNVAILIAVLVGVFAIIYLMQAARNRRRKTINGLDLTRVTYWKRFLPDSNIDITLIECDNGMQLLDEADGSGNGIITLFHGPGKEAHTKKCFSLIKRSAALYSRKDYQQLKVDCVKKFSVVRQDFDKVIGETLTTARKIPNSVQALANYLKEIHIIRQ